MQGPPSDCPSSPTTANFPFLIVTDDTIELRASRVCIFPLTNFTSREPAQRSSSLSRANAGVNIVTPAINDDTTNNETRLRVFMTPPLSFFSTLLPSTAYPD